MKKRIVSLLLSLMLAFSLATAAFAAVSDTALSSAVTGTAAYLYTLTPAPQVGSIGGEWAVLGLARSGCSVPEQSYQDYYAAVEALAARKIVNGLGDGTFNHAGTITRQEAATMVARAARLCGMDTEYSAAAARDILSQFGDYTKCADWARSSLAFCYDQGILDDSALNIQPTVAIKRCEIAQMLYNMLEKSNLL